MFHQREIVRIGEPEAVADWREMWRDRAVELLAGWASRPSSTSRPIRSSAAAGA